MYPQAATAGRGRRYGACMFCEETGDCNGDTDVCHRHEVTWDVWEDRYADAENSAF